jgi:hypothetical protein
MNWTEQPQGFGNGGLRGKLTGISLTLEPNSKDLKDYALELHQLGSISSFKHKVNVKKGEIVGESLTFVVTTMDPDAHVVLDKWVEMVGPSDSTAQLKVQYNAKQQMSLDDQPAADAPAEDKPRGRKRTEAVQ